jgi:hypothetical protein
MTFRIRHEETNVKIISLVSCLLCFQVISFFCLITENVDEIPAWLALIFVSILIVLIAGSFRHLLRKQQIALDAIGNIQIERYQRHRRRTHSGVHYFIQPETDRPDRHGNNRRKRLVRPHGSDSGRQCAALSGISVHPVGAEPDACLLSPS